MMTRPFFRILQVAVCLLAVPVSTFALISRHNEQGLSPTHSYKRSGAAGVISNLNGNLAVTSSAGQFGGAPLGVSVSRTWNSHWRDPLFADQYDMDPSGIDFKNKRQPDYRDRDFTLEPPQSIGGFATRRMLRYDSPEFVPNGWAFAAAVGVQSLQPIVRQGIILLMNERTNGALAQLFTRINTQTKIAEALGKKFDPKVLTPEEQDLLAKYRLAGAAVQGAFYLAQGGVDDMRTMYECANSAVGGASASGDCVDAMINFTQVAVAPFEWGGTAASVLAYGQMGYNLAKGDADGEDLAWFMGNQVAQYIVASVFESALAGGMAGVAVGVAIQMTRLYIEMYDLANNTFDVGNVHVAPWTLGVNGRLGIVGLNHENHRTMVSPRFHVQWTWHTREVDSIGGTEEAPDTTWKEERIPGGVSLHPMSDLQLVGADGGASRFVLSDEDPIVRDGWKWYPYVSLSDGDLRKIYYAKPAGMSETYDLGESSDLSGLQEQANSIVRADSGYYLVKEPNGEIAEYGRGGRKGIDPGKAGYHAFWAVPTRIVHPVGDTVEIVRDVDHELVRAYDVRTGRGFEVQNPSGDIQRVIGRVWSLASMRTENPVVLKSVDTVVYGMQNRQYVAYHSITSGPALQTVRVVEWEARRVGATQIDTTRFSYDNGDLVKISFPNGSASEYTYPRERQSALDGFVLSAVDLPDASDPARFTKRLYDYQGWSVKDPPVLKTSVTTILAQSNHIVGDLPVRTSQITDWYTFAPMIAAINVNRKLAGYVGRTTIVSNGKLEEVEKLQDSLEYRTTRFQLVREVHGVGSPSMSRTQWVYVGDRPQGKIESRGYGQIWDPRVTVWEYDRQGSVVAERVCPKDLSSQVEQNLTGLPIGGVFKATCPEVASFHGIRHVEDGEFWRIRRDTVRTDSAKAWVDVADRNTSFDPYAQYRIGLETSKRVWRTNSQGGDSTLIADSTEYEDWRPSANAKTWTRNWKSRVYDPGAAGAENWPEMGRVAYADAQRRPTLAATIWSRLGQDSARVVETTYDSAYALFPVAVKSYPKATTMGGTGSGTALVTSRTYDLERGWVLSETTPGNRTSTTVYDRIGRPVAKTAPDGGVTTTEYVDRLQELSSWRSSSSVPGYGTLYPAQKTVAVREKDPMGATTEARFDGLGRLVAVKKLAIGASNNTLDTAQQQTILVSHNIFDKLQWKRDADGRQEFNDFDLSGRLVKSRRYVNPAAGALGLAWESSYDWNDSARTLIERDPLGTRTTFHWDGHGRDTLIERDSAILPAQESGDRSAGLVPMVSAGKIQVRQQYANTGELLKIIDPKGLVETRKYDRRGRLLQTIYPDDLRHAVGYDLAGRVVQDTLASVLQPSNRVVKAITYDALDRMLLESYGVGARENTAYSWDQHGSRNDPGQLLAVTRGTGLVAKYTYDPNARRLERTVENASLSYSLGMSDTFDVGGAIVRQRIPGGAGFGFGYDAFRRLRSITFGQGADSVPVLSDARYRSNDLVDGYRLGARLWANYGYESQRSFMTTNKVVRHPAGNPTAVQDTLLLQKLEWDASGNVAGMQRPIGDTLGYRHDRLGQLRATARAGGMDSLQYDANGNRTRHRFTLDGGVPDSLAYNANRVAWMRTARNGHTLFRHDVLGNLTLEAHFASAADTTDLSKAWKIVERKFNRRNELERVVVKDRQTMDSTLWAYDYDEAGNRILKRYAANLDTTQWKTERRYAYDGVNVVADSGRGDSSWTWHVFQGYNRLALADKPGSALRVKYLLNDHLGTANVMVDDTGRVLAKYARDPWGNLESSWESTPLRWQFTGKEQDPEVGGNVIYFNARFYDGERGAFISADPMEQYWSPYSYVGGAPLAWFDPLGLVGENPMTGTCIDGPGDMGVRTTGIVTGPGQINIETIAPVTIGFGPAGYRPGGDISSIPTSNQQAIQPMSFPGVGTIAGLFWGGVNQVRADATGWALQQAGVDASFMPTGLVGKGWTKMDVAGKNGPKISTGRTDPRNLKEQLAMQEVVSNPKGYTPPRMPAMSDTKNGLLAKDGWVKRVQNVNGVEIHFVENVKTGQVLDFKFKD